METILKMSLTGTPALLAKTFTAMNLKNVGAIKLYPHRKMGRGTFTVYLDVETTTGRIKSNGVQVN